MQAAVVERMGFSSNVLEEIIANLHQLYLVAENEQRDSVGLSIFGRNFVNQQVAIDKEKLQAREFVIGRTATERAQQMLAISEKNSQ